MPSRMNEEKIIEIETAIAHHEQQLTEMSEVITDQWKMIDALKRALDKANAKIERLEGGGGDNGQGGEALVEVGALRCDGARRRAARTRA